MFGLGLMGEKLGAKLLQPFTEVGHRFGECGHFSSEIIKDFSIPEYLSEKQIRMAKGPLRHIQRLIMRYIAKRLGCKTSLGAKPFREIN